MATKYRNRDMQHLWSDFQAERPAMAKLIIADVEHGRSEAAAANQEPDERLREAERMVTKARKPKKVTKSRKDVAEPGTLAALRAAQEALRSASSTWDVKRPGSPLPGPFLFSVRGEGGGRREDPRTPPGDLPFPLA